MKRRVSYLNSSCFIFLYLLVLMVLGVQFHVDPKEGNPEDDEEKEQERLAKRFAKRARMNRILEAYEGDNEFSRSRLIDEDTSMQIELKTMKVHTRSNDFCFHHLLK